MKDVKSLIEQALVTEVALPYEWWEPLEPYHRFLFTLIQDIKPFYALELGVRMGPGVLHMALGNPGTEVWGFDVEILPQAHQVELLYDNIILYEIDSVEGINTLTGGRIFDVVHIDTIHYAHQVKAELEAIYPSVARGGVICIDDIRLFPDMSQYWDSILMNDPRFRATEDVRLHPWNGPTKNGVSYGVLEVL